MGILFLFLRQVYHLAFSALLIMMFYYLTDSCAYKIQRQDPCLQEPNQAIIKPFSSFVSYHYLGNPLYITEIILFPGKQTERYPEQVTGGVCPCMIVVAMGNWCMNG